MIGTLFNIAAVILDPSDSIVRRIGESMDNAAEQNRKDELQLIEDKELARLRAKRRFDNEQI